MGWYLVELVLKGIRRVHGAHFVLKLATRVLSLLSDRNAKMAARAPISVRMGWYLAKLVLKGIANLKFKFEINIEGEKVESFPISIDFIFCHIFTTTFKSILSHSWSLFYSLGAGACKMAAEQPFLQNESSGLPPACKPKLQQAGVYYLVSSVHLNGTSNEVIEG